ncbi:hypothetical protein XELAEV_18039023mg [Xenopus laevis]|uniref:Uncharacterized protein n=1 Tax=Xenopus laevis TaxID=8355 RepID=A0A974C6R0_XENLA|nr:hypothetical protein XELAEV_18039023mg [Xenopus laevis]
MQQLASKVLLLPYSTSDVQQLWSLLVCEYPHCYYKHSCIIFSTNTAGPAVLPELLREHITKLSCSCYIPVPILTCLLTSLLLTIASTSDTLCDIIAPCVKIVALCHPCVKVVSPCGIPVSRLSCRVASLRQDYLTMWHPCIKIVSPCSIPASRLFCHVLSLRQDCIAMWHPCYKMV